MAKRTGLGRGIGALIPTGTEAKERPADVFFAGSALPAAPETDEETTANQDPSTRAAGAAAKTKKASTASSRTGSATKPAAGPTGTAQKGAAATKGERAASGSSKARTATSSASTKSAPAKSASAKSSASKSTSTKSTAPTSIPAKGGASTRNAAAPPASADEPLTTVPGLHLVEVDPHAVTPNPRQPRRLFDADDLAELVHSVREFGVLQPIVVRDKHDGTYELIMGERRTRAAREAKLPTIPAIVRETADEDLLRDALLENVHRAELNALEEASAYQQLIEDFGITQDQLADRIGRSRPQISNTIRLLRLPETVQQRVAAGVLSAGHARAILSLDGDTAAMEKLADKIVNEELSVRSAETAAKQVTAGATSASRPKPKTGARRAYLDEVSDKLGDRLNTKVKIDLTARKGQIKIGFGTIQDLNRILGELGESGYEQ